MPRSASGVYTLPVPPFIPNTVIRSADVNSDFSDVATALTQSLATTGVSSMTGPIKAAAGSSLVPSYSYAAATGTGWFLSGTNESSYVTPNGIVVVFGASTTVTWSGDVFYSGNIAVLGSLAVSGSTTLGSDLTVNGNANLRGNVVVATTSVNVNQKIALAKITDPTSAAANNAFFYVKSAGPNNYAAPYTENENGQISPLLFQGGQCQLTKSGANLLLSPFGGNLLTVNGVPCVVPNAGITLPASNSAATFVYIYAIATSGVITSLEMSTTVPAIQTGTGVQQKTGDSTRTLVGAAYTDAGGAWADTDGKLWVLSYFNRRPKKSKINITATLSTSSQIYVEADSTSRNNFISWGDEIAIFNTYIPWTNAAATGIYGQNNVDGTLNTGANNGSSSGPNVPGNTQNATVISGVTENTTHYGALFVRCSTSVTTFFGGAASAGEQGAIYIIVRG